MAPIYKDTPQKSFRPAVILPIKPYLQKRLNDCGPAVLKTVLDTLGRKIALPTLARLAKTDKDGTRPANLSRALKLLRVRHQVFKNSPLSRLERQITDGHLCIVDYQAWGEGHYSVIYGFNKKSFLIADPLKIRAKNRTHCGPPAIVASERDGRGLRTIRKDLFEKRWHDHGPAGEVRRWMLCVAVPNFKLRNC